MWRPWLAVALLLTIVSQGYARPRDLPRGNAFWEGEFETQEEMIPPFVFMLFDLGGTTRGDHDASAKEFLLRGIPVTIALNAGIRPDYVHPVEGVSAVDQLRNIRDYTNLRLPEPRTQGAERPPLKRVRADALDMVEFVQHGNTSITPEFYGFDPADYGDGNDTWGDDEWDVYHDFTYQNWVDEFKKDTMLELLWRSGWTDVTADDIRGVVWPGDGNPYDRAFAARNVEFFSQLFKDLGYDYAHIGTGSAYQDSTYTGFLMAGNTPIAEGRPQKFINVNAGYPIAWVPGPSTRDLGSGYMYERDASVPWAPEGTVNWTIKSKAPDPYHSGYGDYRDGIEANYSLTVRGAIALDMAAGGGSWWWQHSENDTKDFNITLNYPIDNATGDPMAANTDLTEEEFGGPNDWKWLAATAREYIKKGYLQGMTYSEGVHYLASKPAEKGLIVSGGPPKFAWYDIGDTNGIQPRYIPGWGHASTPTPNSGTGSFLAVLDTDGGSGEYDGRLLTDKFGIGDAAEYHWMDDGGRYGKGAALLLSNGGNYTICNLQGSLIPGKYRLEVSGLNMGSIRFDSPFRIWEGFNSAKDLSSDGTPELDLQVVCVDTLIANGTIITAGDWYTNQGNGFAEPWPQNTPADATGEVGWQWAFDFEVNPANYSYLSTINAVYSDNSWASNRSYRYTAYITPVRAKAGSDPRLEHIHIRWMGNLD